MSTETIEYCGELTVLTCWCGMRHAVPEELRSHQLRQHANGQNVIGIFCPLGHSHIPSGEGAAEKLRKELEQKNRIIETKTRYAEGLEKERDAAQFADRAKKGVITKLKKRIAAGHCPCCHRHFVDLHAHMDNKHPEFKKEI